MARHASPAPEGEGMKRSWSASVMVALLVGLLAEPAGSKAVEIAASPNPANVGSSVRHTVALGTAGRLDIWVSASGFQRPGTGTLPPGSWVAECCPARTAGTPAWHYRSFAIAPPGPYRFGAVARMRGTFLSSAAVGFSSDGVWIRIT
jgi:hypothetical protein